MDKTRLIEHWKAVQLLRSVVVAGMGWGYSVEDYENFVMCISNRVAIVMHFYTYITMRDVDSMLPYCMRQLEFPNEMEVL